MTPQPALDAARKNRRTLYRTIALFFGASFAVVGVLFLVVPGGVLGFFNGLSVRLGFASGEVEKTGFFGILAAAYMYVVSLLAVRMYRHPDVRLYPVLLMNAKFASALLSVGFFLAESPLLIYLANALVDAGIGFITLYLMALQKSFTA